MLTLDVALPDQNCVFWHEKEYFQFGPGSRCFSVRVWLITTRVVKAGEELFVHLGDDIAARIEEMRMQWPEYRAYLKLAGSLK